jgi:coatomer subunit beta
LLKHPLLPPLLLLLLQVSSTETGVIFGNIVYEGGGTSERGVVVLADIHIDIMDYISPASCADVTFRNMWAEFEWENKVRGGRQRGGGAS